MADDPLTECEECGAAVERVFHPVAVHFKGSGFYTTDYGSKSKSKAARREAPRASRSPPTASRSPPAASRSPPRAIRPRAAARTPARAARARRPPRARAAATEARPGCPRVACRHARRARRRGFHGGDRRPLQAARLHLPLLGDLRRARLDLRLRPLRRPAEGQRQGRVVALDAPGARRHRRPRLGDPPASPGLGGLAGTWRASPTPWSTAAPASCASAPTSSRTVAAARSPRSFPARAPTAT